MWLKFQGVWVLLFIASCTAAAGKGLTREVNGLQPQCLLRVFPAGNQGQGNFPAVWAAPGHDHISHNTQKHFHHLLPPPNRSLSLPPCVFSAVSLKSHSSLSLLCLSSFHFLSPLSLPSRDTPMCSSEPVSVDLWYTLHFLSRLWRPALCPINLSDFLFSDLKRRKNAVGLFKKKTFT